jgi:hypothetical protein
MKIYLVLIITILLNSCNYRTPSKDRFEKITGVELSDSIKVIEDRFEESGPDYGLSYKISISEKDCVKLTENIEKSKDWTKDGNMWRFHKVINGITYDIVFFIVEHQILYSEELI